MENIINRIIEGIDIEGVEMNIRVKIPKRDKKVTDYKYEKEYESTEEFNRRNVELGRYRYYIAYGSNMNLGQMGYRCPDSRFYSLGYIEGYRLEFRDKYSNIKVNRDSQVPAVVYRISDRDEKILDEYEKDYEKKEIRVRLTGKEFDNSSITGLIYIMKKTKRDRDNKEIKRLIRLPNRNYFEIIRKSYEFYGFDKEKLTDSLIHSFNIYYKL